MIAPPPQQVLALPMPASDAGLGCATICDYLIRLLADLWAQGSDFNAKRPFGGSNWRWVVYEQMVKAGLVTGTFDEDGYIKDADIPTADRLIADAIQLFGTELDRLQTVDTEYLARVERVARLDEDPKRMTGDA